MAIKDAAGHRQQHIGALSRLVPPCTCGVGMHTQQGLGVVWEVCCAKGLSMWLQDTTAVHSSTAKWWSAACCQTWGAAGHHQQRIGALSRLVGSNFCQPVILGRGVARAHSMGWPCSVGSVARVGVSMWLQASSQGRTKVLLCGAKDCRMSTKLQLFHHQQHSRALSRVVCHLVACGSIWESWWPAHWHITYGPLLLAGWRDVGSLLRLQATLGCTRVVH
jgi:hypothetical protein